MQRLLSDKGITFNVFSSYSTLNKKTPESPILGVNYLGKQIINKKSSGEAGIDRLDIPDGQYAKLAKATRGKSCKHTFYGMYINPLSVKRNLSLLKSDAY